MSDRDHYRVLNVSRDASVQEIKQQYLNLSRQYHPDASGTNDSKEFIEIQEAWEILRNEDSRLALDKDLDNLESKNYKTRGEISEVVKISEMDFNEDGDVLSRPCRCGSTYDLSTSDAYDFNEVIVVCSGCSLKIKIENDL
ncbi:DnaJ [Acrasis kona]|uniref:DnaJ n=1 Tax=Acrasis kona TaxID=1008807 RepID=A0AAW2ZIW7_9EUKA